MFGATELAWLDTEMILKEVFCRLYGMTSVCPITDIEGGRRGKYRPDPIGVKVPTGVIYCASLMGHIKACGRRSLRRPSDTV